MCNWGKTRKWGNNYALYVRHRIQDNLKTNFIIVLLWSTFLFTTYLLRFKKKLVLCVFNVEMLLM